ncbi:CD209 antigen-like protein E [Protopterus annectens]|uniref:CD209 antigen-like protein E n=1 Tax=Protopterus annectens TaxID=7888 RepID=UPI001CFC1BA1|nr:CD209 antigen-like protein E [Protopterus annectens]
MNEDILYADIKFNQSSAGKKSSQPERHGPGTAKQESTTKSEETIMKETGLRLSKLSAKIGVLVVLIVICFLLLVLAIAITLLYYQEQRRNDNCLIQTKNLESNISVLSQKLSHLRDAFCNGTHCILNQWDTSKFSGWTTYFGNSTYFFSSEQLNWESSKNACLLMMSNLVVINSEEEQIFLKNSSSISNTGFWIGFTDQKEEGTWCWVDDPACNTTSPKFWGDDQPSNSVHQNKDGEDCATENYNENTWRSWNDDSCLKDYRWICEKSTPIFYL